jgi:hypothetical protein
MVQEIERETRARQARTGRAPLGRRRILGLDPHDKPDRSKRSPRPPCHAASKAARIGFRRAYSEFCVAFRQAAEDLRSSLRAPESPIGSFPPRLPYVGAAPRSTHFPAVPSVRPRRKPHLAVLPPHPTTPADAGEASRWSCWSCARPFDNRLSRPPKPSWRTRNRPKATLLTWPRPQCHLTRCLSPEKGGTS